MHQQTKHLVRTLIALMLTLAVAVSIASRDAWAQATDIADAASETSAALVAQSDGEANADIISFQVTGRADTSVGKELLALVNQSRREESVAELAWDNDLAACAVQRATELAIRFEHNRPDGSLCFTAWPNSEVGKAENIAYGYLTATDVNEAWKGSEGHYSNMVKATHRSFGAALFVAPSTGKHFWVECFAASTPTSSSQDPITGTVVRDVRVSKGLIETKLSVLSGSLNMATGTTTQMGLLANDADVVSTFVSWSTNNAAVASVSTGGVVSALSNGTATITGYLKSLPNNAAQAEVTVSDGNTTWSRIAGPDRYQTMAQIVNAGFTSSTKAIVCTGENFPDALAASSLAGTYECPVILTSPTMLSAQAKDRLEKLGITSVCILGGESSVNGSVADQIASMGITVSRIAGADRMQTSIEALKAAREAGSTSNTVIIATGRTFADSLSIGPWAYASASPIVLAAGDGTLTSDAVAAIKANEAIRNVVIVGGHNSVTDDVIGQLGGAYDYTRLAGNDRYETSAGIASWEATNGLSFATTMVTTGENFPDALAGAPLVGSRRGVLLLVSTIGNATTAKIEEKASAIRFGYVLGGESSVPQDMVAYLQTLTD